MKSTFVRKGKRAETVRTLSGSYKSLLTGYPLISTGHAELDHILCGGYPLGSLTIVEQEPVSGFAKILLKYFLAEGVACHHNLFVGSSYPPPDQLLAELPPASASVPPSAQQQGKQPDIESAGANASGLKIAWQYEKYLNDNQSDLGRTGTAAPSHCHSFDVSKRLDAPTLAQIQPGTILVSMDPNEKGLRKVLRESYSRISQIVQTTNENATSRSDAPALRIGIFGLPPLTWGSVGSEDLTLLTSFLHALRGLLRCSAAAAVIVLPPSIFTPMQFARLCSFADTVIGIEGFVDKSQVSPDFAAFHGILTMRKLPLLGAVAPLPLEHRTYTLQKKHKKLHIDSIHLQPELARTSTAGKSEESLAKGVAAAATEKIDIHNIDF